MFKIIRRKIFITIYSLSFVSVSTFAMSSKQDQALQETNVTFKQAYETFLKQNSALVDAFEENAKQNVKTEELIEKLEKWQPTDSYFINYKKYFKAHWSNDQEKLYDLYTSLKKQKNLVRVRYEIITTFLNLKLDQIKIKDSVTFLKKESRSLMRQLKGSTEGDTLESNYLKWLAANKLYADICSTEKKRWSYNVDIEFVELTTATENCQIEYDDFLTRLRRLIFAAKEYQALREIELYSSYKKLKEWEKSYLVAVYDTHLGDPVKAFQDISQFEKEFLESEYKTNYFYIAQRAGQHERAEKIVKQLLKTDLKRDELKELEFQQGFLFYQLKKYKEANKVFDSIYKKHSHFKRKKKNKDFEQVAWLRAWTLYLDGNFISALKAFEDTLSYASDEARLAYWISDTQYQLGEEVSAISGFRKLASPILENKYFSYYNLLAWVKYEKLRKNYKSSDLIKNISALAKMNKGLYPVASDSLSYSEIMDSYSFFEKNDFETDEGEIQVINSENEVIENVETNLVVGSFSDLASQMSMAQFLMENNEVDLARWHLYEIEKKTKDRKKVDILTTFYLDQQLYYRALSLMNKTVNAQKVSTSLKADPIFWQSMYPEAYMNQVMKYSGDRKIDPYLILSIMRAETLYKFDAISPVGAVGLMQFMPYTAEKMFDLIDVKMNVRDLFKPENSVLLGAAYLKKLSVELDYQKPLIAAAYNGGPHRVKSWLKNLGQIDFDRFIEHIPFAETRTYVKRVVSFRAIYEKIYKNNLRTDTYNYLIQPIPIKTKDELSLKEDWLLFKNKL